LCFAKEGEVQDGEGTEEDGQKKKRRSTQFVVNVVSPKTCLIAYVNGTDVFDFLRPVSYENDSAGCRAIFLKNIFTVILYASTTKSYVYRNEHLSKEPSSSRPKSGRSPHTHTTATIIISYNVAWLVSLRGFVLPCPCFSRHDRGVTLKRAHIPNDLPARGTETTSTVRRRPIITRTHTHTHAVPAGERRNAGR